MKIIESKKLVDGEGEGRRTKELFLMGLELQFYNRKRALGMNGGASPIMVWMC